MTIGDRIRSLRNRRKWTQGQLLIQARRYIPPNKRLARETLSRIENGQERVDLWVLEACAAALGVGVGDLLRDDAPAGAPAGVADLDPDVAELAARINELAEAQRERVVDVISGVLALTAGEEPPAAQTPNPLRADQERRFLRLLDALTEPELEDLIRRLAAENAAAHDAAARTG